MKRGAIVPADFRLRIDGDVEQPLELSPDELIRDRSELTADLHCVTTWSALGLRWSGMPFRRFWDEIVVARARPRNGVAYLRISALDGYRAVIPLEEALHENAWLADRLAGEPLGAHGAPLRLIVPQLYGYKSVKHVCRIQVTVDPVRGSTGRVLAHPRGRVDREERSGIGLQRFWRVLYRVLLPLFLWRARKLAQRS
jgi:DMSO/TMAO reductase YedYZ molybdopterin-dependent catalytic subunit